MSWNMGYGSTHGPPFFNELDGLQSQDLIASDRNSYSQETEFYSVPLMERENLIDPSLRGDEQSSMIELSKQTQRVTQQQPMARYIGEAQPYFFTTPVGIQTHFAQGSSVPIGSLPYAIHSQQRLASPSPSQGLTSTCSSAQSPAADFDLYQDFNSNFGSQGNYSQNRMAYSQNMWSPGPNMQNYPPQFPGQSCVNLSQVQSFEDHQDASFDTPDEGYDANSMSNGYCVEVDTRMLKTETDEVNYNSPTDEGIGASIKDHHSPQDFTSLHNDEAMSEGEADADGDLDIEVDTSHIEEAEDDTDYNPRSSRSSRTKSTATRRTSKAISPLSPIKNKTSRINKNTKATHTCKTCSGVYKDVSSLQKHITKEHTRAFVCVFSFAGCGATFGSKNEWKRHVSSQHTNFQLWVCNLGSCGKVPSPKNTTSLGAGGIKGSEFNRKDLFTQHVKRMHTPIHIKKQKKPVAEFEEHVKLLQTKCLVEKRKPPTKLVCPVASCEKEFVGSNCWDERMEHVGKHLEKTGSPGGKGGVDQERDSLLVNWALNVHIIERVTGGGYALCGATSSVPFSSQPTCHDEDDDAEGEDDEVL